MLIGIGLKAHSGWAVLVALGKAAGEVQVVDRRRIDLVAPADASWAKQPYHAGARFPEEEAERIVQRGIKAAEREASEQMLAIRKRAAAEGHEIRGCGILIGSPMPNWTTQEILSVHVRMHKAEGVLFPQALVAAARECRLTAIEIPEKALEARASQFLPAAVIETISSLGRTVGPPWGKDQKNAAIAALLALSHR